MQFLVSSRKAKNYFKNSSSEGILASIIVLLKLSQSASTSFEGCLDCVHFYAMLPHYCQLFTTMAMTSSPSFFFLSLLIKFSHATLRLKALIKGVKFQYFH